MKSKINKAKNIADDLKDENWIKVPEGKKEQKIKGSIIRGKILSPKIQDSRSYWLSIEDKKNCDDKWKETMK